MESQTQTLALPYWIYVVARHGPVLHIFLFFFTYFSVCFMWQHKSLQYFICFCMAEDINAPPLIVRWAFILQAFWNLDLQEKVCFHQKILVMLKNILFYFICCPIYLKLCQTLYMLIILHVFTIVLSFIVQVAIFEFDCIISFVFYLSRVFFYMFTFCVTDIMDPHYIWGSIISPDKLPRLLVFFVKKKKKTK